MSIELEQRIAQLEPGEHICPIHDGLAEQLAVTVPFIKSGLERNERCIYVAGEDTRKETERALAAAGIDVERERERSALVFRKPEETYLIDGRFDGPRTLGLLRKAEAKALEAGFSGVRMLGAVADWELRSDIHTDQLIEYEAMLNRFASESHSICLCHYDRQRFDAAVIHDVLRTHSVAIIGELVCPNPYYEPPELVLNRDRMATVEFKRQRAAWWIERLKAMRLAERERERAEAAVHENEERLHLLLNSTAEGIYGMDRDGSCNFANQACARLLGYSDPLELEGENMHRLVHHSRADGTPYPEPECPIVQALGRGAGVYVDDEVFWRADGSPFPAEYRSFPVRRGGQIIGAVVTFLDISERKALEGQMRQSQRLEALGQLTGGIAHDFNNLLTVVLGNADMLVEDTPPGTEQHEQAEIIRSAAERGADLINRMLAFARRQPLHPEAVNVNDLIRSMDGLLQRSLGGHIEMRLDLSSDIWLSLIDPSQLETAILNLAINARDAMPDGGRLVIGTANVRLDAAFCASRPDARPGDYVTIGVTDSGIGMSPELLEKAPQPFFTTKEVGKGTGLGLSMVYGFAKQSEGHIEMASELGQGTTITLYLPRAGGRTRVAASEREGEHRAAQGRGEVILVVEDDDLVRDYVAAQLRALGYQVVLAADGPAGLEILRNRTDIHLLFTDVMMPGGLSGLAMVEQAIRVRPGLKVLYTSGYAENVLLRQGRLPVNARLLSKPYRLPELAAEVRRALDR